MLFIDELHTVVGAGKAEGGSDAANLLKPALARGQLRCVGATTLDEYRQYIEKDAALERRFQPVYVQEPNVEDAIAIMRGLKSRYETPPRSENQRLGNRCGGRAFATLTSRIDSCPTKLSIWWTKQPAVLRWSSKAYPSKSIKFNVGLRNSSWLLGSSAKKRKTPLENDLRKSRTSPNRSVTNLQVFASNGKPKS